VYTLLKSQVWDLPFGTRIPERERARLIPGRHAGGPGPTQTPA
jgi:hypothetical protein